MELVKVFCLTKDEHELIEDFILYYGYVFGYHNVVIIDNISTDKRVLDVYDRYLPLGITIHYEEGYAGAMPAIIFNKVLNMYKGQCHFLVPIDTDEFMIATDECQDPTDRDHIQDIFRQFPAHITLANISKWQFCCPESTNPHFINHRFSRPVRQITSFVDIKEGAGFIGKVFFRSSAFIGTQLGNHTGMVSHGGTAMIRIGYLHFHYTGNKRQFERARALVNGHGHVDVENTSIYDQLNVLKPFRQGGLGFHRVDQYCQHLTKIYIVQVFKEHVHRLPDKTEIKKLVDSYCSPEDTLKQIQSMQSCERGQEVLGQESLDQDQELEAIDELVFGSMFVFEEPTITICALRDRLHSINAIAS